MLKPPRCYTRKCIHFIGVNGVDDESQDKVVCNAFPEGIPDEVAWGENLHLQMLPGDNGITFEKMPQK